MSSPIANNSKTAIQQLAVSIHQHASHSKRIAQLTSALATAIASLGGSKICVDVGCGDMTLAEGIALALPETKWTCLDVYPVPQEKLHEPRWEKYMHFDGKTLPLADGSSDIVLFSDVLHHASVNDCANLIADALRVGKYVVIKDHFEYGLWSRTLLQLMDIFGNWGYGVSIPKKYFTQTSFNRLASQANCKVTMVTNKLALYGHIPLLKYILRPDWQFIAILSRADH
jgi:ubiquinone/menaquinone biosynthesis C-methylase UbiE